MSLTPDLVFRLANGLALLAWIALFASPPRTPWHRWTWRISGRLVPALFALVYVILLAQHWPAQGGFGSIAQVQALFAAPGALVAGWVHYLAFDLFVGTWIASRAAELALPHWQIVPVLLLTFLFGPAGLLAFLLLRSLRRPASLRLTPESLP